MTQPARIRAFRDADLEDLYRIALATGDNGADASALYRDLRMVGHIYAAPYGMLSPETAFVAEDARGVAGYIVGALDTRAFETRLEADWWPRLRPLYADPAGTPHEAWSPDQLRAYMIHHPFAAPERVVRDFPAHLHINLLPRLQGQGMGRRLIDHWLTTMRELGAKGVHLGVSRPNTRAIRFYEAYGFDRPETLSKPGGRTLYFTKTLVGPA